MHQSVSRVSSKIFEASTSGANGKGQHGVDAWVHRSVVKKARDTPDSCSLRLLVLKNDGQIINLTVSVAHAPPNDSGEQGRTSFWNLLRKAAQAVPRARTLALLIDANGRVGTPKSKFIGACPSNGYGEKTGRHIAFPRRRVRVPESRRATNMWAQSGAGDTRRC